MERGGVYKIQFIPKVKENSWKINDIKKFGKLQLQSLKPVYLGLSFKPVFTQLSMGPDYICDQQRKMS